MGKDFRVDPDKLEAVAKRVEKLLKQLDGSEGYTPGSTTEFAKADQSAIVQALGTLAGNGDGTDAFAGSYGLEHEGMTKTYGSMITQLQNLYGACHSTAEAHRNHETGAKTAVLAPGEAI